MQKFIISYVIKPLALVGSTSVFNFNKIGYLIFKAIMSISASLFFQLRSIIL